MANQHDHDTAEAARRRATRARMARLRKESPFKKKTGESTNRSNFGAMGARGTTGKRKPPQFVCGAQARPVEREEKATDMQIES